MQLNLKESFLAYLSACKTAKGNERHVDKVVHLAAMMLFAGFKSVIATMWCVLHLLGNGDGLIASREMRDEDSPVVATEFYQQLFANLTLNTNLVPYTLDDAVAMLWAKGASLAQWATFIHMGA